MKRSDLVKYTQEQCAAYHERYDQHGCEVTELIRKYHPAFVTWERNHCAPGLAVHHIWGRTSRPLQSWCNLVLVSTAAHEWGHQRGEKHFNVSLAFEACCLAAKRRRQHWMVTGPEWQRETQQHRQHWCLDAMNAARATCLGWTTLLVRVEHLDHELGDTPFGAVTRRLLQVIREEIDPMAKSPQGTPEGS